MSHVYFMQPVGGGPIKIGYTENVERRRAQLEVVFKKQLVVLATRRGGRKEEAEIHAKFIHLRIGPKEQFRPGPDLMEFIGRPLLAVENHEEVAVIPTPENRQQYALTMRGTRDWKGWLERLAHHCRRDMVGLIDEALAGRAKELGFEKPPKR